MKQFANILAILAAVVLMDGHWIAMQTVTWADMAREASSLEDTSLADVLTGRTVCEHCKAIKSGQNTEGERVFEYLSQARTLAPVTGTPLELPPRASQEIEWATVILALADQADHGVLLPPPRV